MVEWWKNVVDLNISGENPVFQRSCHCSTIPTGNYHSYNYNVDIKRHKKVLSLALRIGLLTKDEYILKIKESVITLVLCGSA